MSKIKTIKELRSKSWYWWLKKIYFFLYLSFIIGFLNSFASGLDRLGKSNVSVSAKDWFWILFMPVIFFFFLFIFYKIVKKGFYYLIFKTTKPAKGEVEKEKTMDELYQPIVKN